MDPNLLYWKSEGKSFLSRLRIWTNLLDPFYLVSPAVDIERARCLISSCEDKLVKDEQVENAWHLSLACVHADTGKLLPTAFRPQALLPLSGPLIVASLLPHSGVKPALFWQFLLQTYSAGFNYANRNSSAEQNRKIHPRQAVLLVGSVTYATCAGALPQIALQRLGLTSPAIQWVFRSVLPVPLSAALAYFNVMIVRGEEPEHGVQVFDSNGNSVGLSKQAGAKAVRDTGLSRATLLGTTAALPNVLVYLLQKTSLVKQRPMLMAPVRLISTGLVLGLMIPVSLSLFPQLGTIKREHLEKELQAAAVDGHLFYHRGL